MWMAPYGSQSWDPFGIDDHKSTLFDFLHKICIILRNSIWQALQTLHQTIFESSKRYLSPFILIQGWRNRCALGARATPLFGKICKQCNQVPHHFQKRLNVVPHHCPSPSATPVIYIPQSLIRDSNDYLILFAQYYLEVLNYDCYVFWRDPHWCAVQRLQRKCLSKSIFLP